MRRVIALAGAAVLAATVTGCDGSKAKTPPNVEYVNFVAAFQRLHRAGFRVTVPYFPPFGRDERAEQGRGRLSNYVVVRERRFTADAVARTLTPPAGGGADRVDRGAQRRAGVSLGPRPRWSDVSGCHE